MPENFPSTLLTGAPQWTQPSALDCWNALLHSLCTYFAFSPLPNATHGSLTSLPHCGQFGRGSVGTGISFDGPSVQICIWYVFGSVILWPLPPAPFSPIRAGTMTAPLPRVVACAASVREGSRRGP